MNAVRDPAASTNRKENTLVHKVMNRKGLAISAAVFVATMLTAMPAAAHTQINRGEAEAVLHAFGSGGWAVINHNSVQFAGPGDVAAAIRPLPKFDGRHYCTLDWHTLVVADIEGNNGPYTEPEARAAISQLSWTFVLDGVTLTLTQTPVSHFNNPQMFGLTKAFYSQWGQVESPAALGVGSHTLRGVETASGTVVTDNTITFYIDPADSTACS